MVGTLLILNVFLIYEFITYNKTRINFIKNNIFMSTTTSDCENSIKSHYEGL